MSDLLKYSVGMDVDKKYIHVCMMSFDVHQNFKICGQRKFENNENGFQLIKEWVEKKHRQSELPLTYTLEPTGVYHEKLAYFLYQNGFGVCIVLANKVKQYMKSLGLKSKNDRSDARGIAQMGAERKLRLWQPISKDHLELKMLTRHKERLENMRTGIRNQLESARNMAYSNQLVIKGLEDLMNSLTNQASAINDEIKTLIESQTSTLKEDVEYTTSITGIAHLTAAVVLSETNSFEHFENERQLTSYCGYDVVENQSGARKGKTKISKKGNSHIRRVLHMASWQVVMREVPHFVNLYERVYAKTGIKKKAYVAVQRKLLCTIYALVKKKEKFDPNYNLPKDLVELPNINSGKGEIQVLQS